MGNAADEKFYLSVELGKRIAAERERQGFKKEKFALEACIDPGYYAQIEGGERNVSMCMLCQIALHLNRDIAYFTKGMPDPDMLAADIDLAERRRHPEASESALPDECCGRDAASGLAASGGPCSD